jgi:imidazolonepropionase-like amidohydrolase
MQRGLRAGRGGSSESVGRAQAASGAYRRLLKRLFDAGVTIVPGTDNVAGLSYHGELEIYERAGIPAPNVLQIATITSARVMKQDADYGSIAVGKVADLAIVAGRPAERIGDLRKTETVVRAGRVYQSKALFEALGIQPR